MQQQAIEGFRLSPQQQRLWRLRDGCAAGTAQCVLQLAGDLSAPALEQALSAVVTRHEILRTRFERLPGMEMPIQVISGEPFPVFREVVLDGGPEALEGLLEQERGSPGLDRGRFTRVSTPESSLLVITLPALLADSRSLDNLAAEIARACGAAPSGGTPDEPLQYVQFSEWQNEVLEDAGTREAREFWDRQRLGEDGPPDLPLQAPELPAAPGIYPVSLLRIPCAPPAGSAREAERVAHEQGASLEAFLLTCWGGLLARLSGSPEIAVDVFFDGRKFPELAEALGPFGRFLPLGLRGLDGRSFARALGRVEATLADARRWQELCPGRTAEEPRLPGFAFEEAGAGPWTGGGVTFSVLDKLYASGDSGLILSARRRGGDLAPELHGDPALYTEEALRLLASRFMALFESALRHPGRPGNELEWIGPEERRRLEAWSLRPLAPVAELVLARGFAAQAARTPEALAVAAGGETLTFRQLARRSGELSRRLRRLGAGPESRIALYLDRSVDAVVALWAVLEAGGAYVPIDAGQTGQRLAWILDDAGVEAVVTHSSLAAALPPRSAIRQVLVDAPAEPDEEGGAPAVAPGPWSCAYVLYTSGSTGHPKGALIENRSVACLSATLATAVYADFEDGSPLRVAVNAPLSFDASVKQVIQLLRGHSLWLVPEEVRGDGEAFLAWLRESRVDVVDCTPSHLRLLLDAGLADGSSPFPRVLLVGGEAIRPDLWREIAADRARRFYNVYGPTECTVDATACRVEPGTGPTLGRALPGVAVHVLDGGLRRVPISVPAELCLAGAQLSRGYLGRPDLTAERFLPDPFAAEPGARLYRTGDRVRFLSDGRLEFLGRLDRQVKVRGIRIEPGEIEAVLRESPLVRDALVVLREDQPGDQRLVAYAVPRRRAAPSSSSGRPRHELPNGMAVVHQNRNETDYLYEEIFEKRCYLQHGVRLPAGACVVDVGANIGMFTLFVHQECARPRVYAFEPIPAVFEALRANCELYGPETKLFPFGLSDGEREESFTFYPRYTMMSSQSRHARPESESEVVKRYLENLRQEGRDGAQALLEDADELLAGRFQGEVVTARLRRLSEVLREEEIGHVDLLKVDVQRAEIEVLKGLDEEDWERIDQIVLEVHDAPGTDSEGRIGEVLSLLERHGFRAVAEQDELLVGTDRYNVYAVSQRLDGTGEEEGPRQLLATAAPVAADVRQFLKSRLPDALVPTAVVWLDEIPLTRNGKVDFAALPPPEGRAPEREAAPPRTPHEEALAGLWAEVLGIERVGVDESFFELGGHSLLATQLMSRTRAAFGVELPLRALFEEPTVEGLAARIEAALRAGEGVETPPIVPVPRDGDLPLSFAQQRFWFLHQLAPDSPAYNSPKAVRLDGRLGVAALERTLGEVVRRHEVLRTTFPMVDGRAVQRIAPAGRFRLPVVDLAGLAGPVREEESARLAREEARRPFDLARGPLLRSALLRLGEEEHTLFFTLHHIASDAWSLGVLMREVAALYSAFLEGRPSPLPELPVQYADVSCWQRRWLSGETLERELAYWRRQLGSEPPILDLPTDRPRPAVPAFQGVRESFRLAEDLSVRLRELSRREGTTLFMPLLAGFQALLARYSGQDRILVGVPIAGRNRRETEDLIGCFLNMLVLGADLSGRPSFRELLAQVRRVSLEAYAHQDLPFEQLVEALAPERGTGRSPLFQVAFGLQNAPRESFELPGLRMHAAGAQLESSRYDLTLWLYEGKGKDSLGVSWTYNAALFEAGTIERMHRHLETLLHEAVSRPDEPLDALEVLTEEEKAELERRKRDLKDANRKRFLAARPRAGAGAGVPQ
ncbi:MAG TPA: amino acid adenylation domain-containing protein [Thermoanaerobaculia bacterium]|nr:amino acid adenylation domain-containing protein [Thermoanaerobaculia bacterium]